MDDVLNTKNAKGLARGPGRLLKRLRALMAARENAQERLDNLTRMIAEETGSDVSSIYLARRSGALELCATHGLSQDAVHKTRLQPGEGLVGQVAVRAKPLAVANAPEHPSFSYRPETGEEPFKSFLGVPILRGGRLVGVLTSQTAEDRELVDGEIETLQTVAMILAEIIASGQIIAPEELAGLDVRPSKSERFQGGAFSPGLAIGVAVVHEPHVSPVRLIADDLEDEEARLDIAINELRRSIDDMLDGNRLPFGGPTRDVLEAYRMFAHDRGWLRQLRDAVKQGLTAEAAVERVRNEHRARLMQAKDMNFRERLHDLEDLANRLLRHLDENTGDAGAPLPEDAILIARSIGPAELLDYDRRKLKGLALEEGSASSHAVIVAKALGIPLVGRVEGALDRVETGDPVILDGEFGLLHIRPNEEVRDAYKDRQEAITRREARYAKLKDAPSVTKDGQPFELHLNAGLLVELKKLEDAGAAGIGLFRTEFQFMVANTLPSVTEQAVLYSSVVKACDGKPAVFRTLDLGGDKVTAAAPALREPNPALGWRAIRMGLDRPGLLRLQLRALIAATADQELDVLFPMIAAPWEFFAAREMLEKEIARAEKFGQPTPKAWRAGLMLETPGMAYALEEALPKIDFVAVGANDLMQYFFAADRLNARVTERYDILSPAALRLLKQIQESCAAHKVPISICGETASRPLEAAVMCALGYTKLSMAASSIAPVRAVLNGLEAEKLGIWLAKHMGEPGRSLRPALLEAGADAGITRETVDNSPVI
ncbi:phosphoenolpyruvate--protein phosphotransferase [Hyphobacterium sp.]|uniref:phosphoenolpyruvate--protein phosphotransferase n=1 Tax=Hyphobacterium sp. TaxID=2004662 RepID=UPI003BA91B15